MIDCCLRPGAAASAPALVQSAAPLPLPVLHAQTPAGAAFLATPDPRTDDPAAQARAAFTEGAAGIFLPHAAFPAEPALTALAAACCDAGCILALGCPPLAGTQGRLLEDVLDLARAFPALRLLLDHLGGGLAFYEQMRAVRRATANVFYGTWGAPELDLPRALEGLPLEKVVFGSAGTPVPKLHKSQWDALDDAALRLLEGVCG